MKCLDDIDAMVGDADAMVIAAESGWPITEKAIRRIQKALINLRAQIVMDVAGVKRAVEIVTEADAPHIVIPAAEVE